MKQITHWKDLLDKPKLANTALICTQDRMHFEPTMKALERGETVSMGRFVWAQMGNPVYGLSPKPAHGTGKV